MKALLDYTQRILTVGFFILLPLLLVYLLLDETFDAVVALASPIADLFPPDTFAETEEPLLPTLLLILSASLAFGLASHLAIGRRFGLWLERKTICRLPLYLTIKSLTNRFVSMEARSLTGRLRYRPAPCIT